MSGQNSNISQPCVNHTSCSAFNFLFILPAHSWSITSYICSPVLREASGGLSYSPGAPSLHSFFCLMTWDFVLKLPSASASWDCDLHVLSEVTELIRVSPPSALISKSPLVKIEDVHRTHLICFPFVKDHCSELPIASSLKMLVYFIYLVVSCWEDKCNSCYIIMAGSRIPVHSLFQIPALSVTVCFSF